MIVSTDPFIQATRRELGELAASPEPPSIAPTMEAFILEIIESVGEMRRAIGNRRAFQLVLTSAHLDVLLFAELHGLDGAMEAYYHAHAPAAASDDLKSYEEGLIWIIGAIGRLVEEKQPPLKAALFLRLSRAMRALWMFAEEEVA